MVTKRESPVEVSRTQTGVRIESRLLKVMKALAEYHDMTLGDFVEGVMLHVLEGKLPFGADTLERAKALKAVYGLTLDACDAHGLVEVRNKRST